jgi:hypothetical protein
MSVGVFVDHRSCGFSLTVGGNLVVGTSGNVVNVIDVVVVLDVADAGLEALGNGSQSVTELDGVVGDSGGAARGNGSLVIITTRKDHGVGRHAEESDDGDG